ncbi:MAG TPA: IS1595 family transposase [Bryobacteraceae bacterium]|nr:IS1595 family transposase [Bryobacteraceae bacterium]
MESKATLRDAILYFADYDHCHQFMVDLRWPNGKIKCPQCGSEKVCYLAKNRVWKCYATHPKPRFTLKTGTIFEDSPIPLEKWLPAVWMLFNCKNGISSWELHRNLGVTQKTAWFMLHRIRLAMQEGDFRKLSGTIESDETFIGGKAFNMHAYKRDQVKMRDHVRMGGFDGKAIVMGILERETGRTRTKVLPNVRQFHVRTNIIENVEKGSTVYTDSLRSYRNLPADGFVHDFVDHTEQYVNGQVHTNNLENFWSLLKRALRGTYVSVEPFHLQAYCDEQAFRYNNRTSDDLHRFVFGMRQVVGKRLTYKELIGKMETETACG